MYERVILHGSMTKCDTKETKATFRLYFCNIKQINGKKFTTKYAITAKASVHH